MILRPAAVLLLSCLAAADEPRTEIGTLISRLGDDDVDVRVRAEARLTEIGKRALPFLRAACRSADPEVAARARQLLGKIEPLRILLGDGSRNLFRKDEPIPVTLLVENSTGGEAAFFPRGFRVTVEVLELHEEPPQEGRHSILSGYGRYSSHCALSESDFACLAQGGTHRIGIPELREKKGLEFARGILERYPGISMITPTLAGRYRVTSRYAYDRAAYLRLCSKRCATHDDPSAPWNRCFPGPLHASAEFTLRRLPRLP